MLLTLIAYIILAALAIMLLGVTLIPVYLWLMVHDARLIAQAQAERHTPP